VCAKKPGCRSPWLKIRCPRSCWAPARCCPTSICCGRFQSIRRASNMALPDIHQRSGYLFLAVILGHILLISAQVNSRTGVPVLEQITFGIFSEVQRGMSSGVSGIRSAWSGYVNLRHVKVENDALKRQLAAAQV